MPTRRGFNEYSKGVELQYPREAGNLLASSSSGRGILNHHLSLEGLLRILQYDFRSLQQRVHSLVDSLVTHTTIYYCTRLDFRFCHLSLPHVDWSELTTWKASRNHCAAHHWVPSAQALTLPARPVIAPVLCTLGDVERRDVR